MPYPNVYYVVGRRDEAYVIPKESSEALLSPCALSFGQEEDQLLYYLASHTMPIAKFELLRNRLKECTHPMERDLLQELLVECRQSGEIDFPDYFGEYPPPRRIYNGIVEKLEKVRNGIYFCKAKDIWYFCVCSTLATTVLSEAAQLFGKESADYLCYDPITCAIPMYELMEYYPELIGHISSRKAILTTLWQRF